MAKGPPSQRYGTPSGRFWRNVVLIALAHVALIAGLIRWSVAARPLSNPESIVWLGGAGDLSADESEKQESPSPKQPPTETESSESEQDEAADEKSVVTTAKSEIELPSATPKPTAIATPAKPSATPALRAKTSPKPIPKPTPKKTLLAKASPKPLAKPKPSPAKANAKSQIKDKTTLAQKDSTSQSGSGQSGSTGKAGSAGGGSSGSEFGWYGNMLHDRFYSAWIQPTTNVPSGAKISALVNVRIEKDGRVSKFEIAKPSENATVNESVGAVAKQISQVDPPPTGLIKGDHYDVKINFELNTEQGASK
jgi:colicin import membrane protein